MIHQTAVIHPAARLGADVQIGPYAIIEGAAEIGDRCVIQAHAVIGAQIVMGADNTVGYGAIIGADPQDLGFKPEVESHVRIGARNRIREYCTIHRGTAPGSATVVGDDCFLMAGAHLGHNVQMGNRVILANNVLLAGHVTVEDNVFLGGGGVFHQFIRVGRMVITQGGSKFSKDIPPYTLAAFLNKVIGLNVIGLRRAGFSPEQRREIKAAFDLLYRGGFNKTQALAASRERTWAPAAQALFDFVADAKKRGICSLIHAGGGDTAGE